MTRLKFAATALLLTFFATDAHAITRIRADLNSCATLQRTLVEQGAAVIRWPSTRVADYFLYDRYVSPAYTCPRFNERPVRTTVPAADNPRCVVHRCERVEPLFDFFDKKGKK